MTGPGETLPLRAPLLFGDLAMPHPSWAHWGCTPPPPALLSSGSSLEPLTTSPSPNGFLAVPPAPNAAATWGRQPHYLCPLTGRVSFPQMYVTLVFRVKGSRLVKPSLCLALLCPAFLVGVVRVAEYRNHWSDVLAGFLTGAAIATFLVSPLGTHSGMGDPPSAP